ncbi:MAG TPA: RNA polymerase sigma factor [Puia sp.]|nr:RNA polymerase sigma factor [Puia sp.]
MPIEPLHDEKELLLQLAEGNESAFTILFGQYQDSIYKTAYWYLKSHAQAQEIVQEVFLKIWQKRGDLGEVRFFKTWLLTLARNYIIDYMRKLASESAARDRWGKEAPSQENGADYKARQSQYQHLLEEAVKGLSPQQKSIYKLAKEQGLSYEEIGVRLSLSPLTVKTHMARALGSIRHFLKAHGEIYLLLLLMGK